MYRHNPELAPGFTPDWFDDPWLQQHTSGLNMAAAGRGDTRLFELEGLSLVLRRYRRGGLVRRLSQRHYVYTGLERTRAMREFALLDLLQHRGLAAPAGVAAEVRRSGLWYSASLLMTQVPGVTLASLLTQQPGLAVWSAVGACIASFHAAGVWHADLNAHNIMIDGAEHETVNVALIDFDRACLRNPGQAAWRQANLSRLQRSLLKLTADDAAARQALGWTALQAAYAGGDTAAR